MAKWNTLSSCFISVVHFSLYLGRHMSAFMAAFNELMACSTIFKNTKPLIHDRTVARNLEGMPFRVKMVRPVPADRNRRDVLQRRQEHGNWFMNHAIMRNCVFIDECGYNIWTAKNHGRARQGERAYRQVCGQRGRNVTVALAGSPVNGLVFHSAYIGGMNAPRFNDFFARRGKI